MTKITTSDRSLLALAEQPIGPRPSLGQQGIDIERLARQGQPADVLRPLYARLLTGLTQKLAVVKNLPEGYERSMWARSWAQTATSTGEHLWKVAVTANNPSRQSEIYRLAQALAIVGQQLVAAAGIRPDDSEAEDLLAAGLSAEHVLDNPLPLASAVLSPSGKHATVAP